MMLFGGNRGGGMMGSMGGMMGGMMGGGMHGLGLLWMFLVAAALVFLIGIVVRGVSRQ